MEAACWRGPAVLQGFAGGEAPTWTAAGRNSGRPVGVAKRYFKALPAGRRQHGRPPDGIRGGLLAWPGGTSKLCRRRSANMDGRRAEFEATCWRGPAILQSFAGGEAPTWTAAGRNSRRPVGVARRYFKALPAGRRQHGRPPDGIRGGLLAWLGGTSKLCRRRSANMDGRRAEFEAACWRGLAMLQAFAGGEAPTWTAAGRNSRRPVGVARRYFKALPAARRQHGRPPGGIRGGLLAWPGGTSKLWRRDGANMDGRRAEFEAACWRGSAVLQAFAGGEAPTWTADGRNSRRPVGMARRYFKVLPAGRRQHGRPPGGRFGPGGRDVPDDRRTPGDAVSQVPGAPPAPGRRHHQSKVRPCPKGAPLPFGARKRPAGRSRRACTCTLACILAHLCACKPAHLRAFYLYSLSHLSK